MEAAAQQALLSADSISLSFGGIKAVQDVSIQVPPGKIISVIGPNGAGKTSLFNVISGIYPQSSGTVRVLGDEVRRNFNLRHFAGIACVSLLVGLSFVAALNLEAVWSDAVNAIYVYREPFDWDAAGAAAIRYFSEEFSLKLLWPLFAGMLFGAVASFVLIKRAAIGPEVACAFGLARTFQNIRLFKEMTALENVMVGGSRRIKSGVMDAIFHTRRHRNNEGKAIESALSLLETVGLKEHANSAAGSLPYGYQRRLEIARALATGPKLLLLDEPAAGMNPAEASKLVELIRSLLDLGVGILLIEHHMHVVMSISDCIYVLDRGELIASGTPAEICSNRRVIEAYLGGSHSAAADAAGARE